MFTRTAPIFASISVLTFAYLGCNSDEGHHAGDSALVDGGTDAAPYIATGGGGTGGSPSASGSTSGSGSHVEAGTSGGTGGTGGTNNRGCESDADCGGIVPDTEPANCAVGRCDVGAQACVFLAKDADGDGFASANCRSLGGSPVEAGLDCDDTNEAVNPGVAQESCNNLDDDCDGQIDEDIQPDINTPCVRPLGALPFNKCREDGFATCLNGKWDGCSVTGKAPESSSDSPYCDAFDYNCNNQTQDDCTCESGKSESCQTPTYACPGTRTCTNGSWGACNANNAATCECANGTRSCTGTYSCPGTDTCSNNQWQGCVCDDPTWECTPGDTRGCSGSPCPATQTCGSNGHWQPCGVNLSCHPTFGCEQTQSGDTQGAVTIGEYAGCFQSCSGADTDGQIGGGQWYSGALPPSGGSVGGTVRAEYAGGGCYSTEGEQALRIECYAALPGCAEPPGGWYAAGNYLGSVTFNQNEVTVPGYGASSATKNLPSTNIEGRTVCCDTYRGTAEWTPECQGCCQRQVVFDWKATAPMACY